MIELLPMNVVAFFNRATGEDRKTGDLVTFYAMEDWVKASRLNRELSSADRFWNSYYTMNYSEPEKGAVAISDLYLSQGEVPLRTTSRPPRTSGWTKKWYQKWMPEVDSRLICTPTDSRCFGVDFKVAEMKKHNVSFHFEDSIEQARVIVRNNDLRTTVVLVPQQCNRLFQPESERIVTVSKYSDESPLVAAYLTLADKLLGSV